MKKDLPMAVTVIDGTVEASETKRRRGKYVIFRTLRLRDRQGEEHSLKTSPRPIRSPGP